MRLFCIVAPKMEVIPPQCRPYVPEVLMEYEGDLADVAEDGAYYTLKGFPDWFYYHHSLFAILPDATADQMQEEKREAIVNLEHELIK